MDNRGNNAGNARTNYNANNNRNRRGKKRVTGRFYAFVSIVVVLVVLVGVFVGRRGNNPQPPVAPQHTPVQQPASETDPAQPMPDVEDTVPNLFDDDGDVPLSEEEIGSVQVDDLSITQGLDPDWYNVLLLGSDSRNVNKIVRTDTIMIGSINTKTGQVRTCSIMRDLMVQHPNKPGSEVKITSIIGLGGPQLIMKMVNELFGMNISHYVIVNFASFQKVIDILGGVRIDISEVEMHEVNKGLGEAAMVAGVMTQEEFIARKDELSLKTYGADTLLTGIQALGYARIRKIDSDYNRTERQRSVLDAILKKAKADIGIGQIAEIGMKMIGEIDTNIGVWDAINLGTVALKGGLSDIKSNGRIPGSSTHFKSETRNRISALYDCDFEANKQLLYKYIYE